MSVVRTPGFHCGGLGSVPGQGTETLHGAAKITQYFKKYIKIKCHDESTDLGRVYL